MKKPTIRATAAFSKDMAETLLDYFDRYAVNGTVEVEVTDHGLWLVNPNGSKQFLGSTERLSTPPQKKPLN